MMMNYKTNQNQDQEQWVQSVVEASEAAVIGYEKYLLDMISHRELAVVMKTLAGLLPMDRTKYNDFEHLKAKRKGEKR
jgi:DNA-binding MltR family transcriptional regulator